MNLEETVEERSQRMIDELNRVRTEHPVTDAEAAHIRAYFRAQRAALSRWRWSGGEGWPAMSTIISADARSCTCASPIPDDDTPHNFCLKCYRWLDGPAAHESDCCCQECGNGPEPIERRGRRRV